MFTYISNITIITYISMCCMLINVLSYCKGLCHILFILTDFVSLCLSVCVFSWRHLLSGCEDSLVWLLSPALFSSSVLGSVTVSDNMLLGVYLGAVFGSLHSPIEEETRDFSNGQHRLTMHIVYLSKHKVINSATQVLHYDLRVVPVTVVVKAIPRMRLRTWRSTYQ